MFCATYGHALHPTRQARQAHLTNNCCTASRSGARLAFPRLLTYMKPIQRQPFHDCFDTVNPHYFHTKQTPKLNQRTKLQRRKPIVRATVSKNASTCYRGAGNRVSMNIIPTSVRTNKECIFAILRNIVELRALLKKAWEIVGQQPGQVSTNTFVIFDG